MKMKKINFKQFAFGLFFFIMVFSGFSGITQTNTPEKKDLKTEWRQLFNGKDLTGWKHVGPGSMSVEDGMIRGHGGMGLLYWTGEKFGNCTIRVEFKMRDSNSNSGIFIRIPIEPREEWMPVNYGYEVQIDNHPELSNEDDYHYTGMLYSMTKPLAKPGKPGPEWNTMEIILDGPKTIVFVNGVKVTEFKEGDPVPDRKFDFEPFRGPRPEYGFVGLQNHGEKDVVFFRKVEVKALQGKEKKPIKFERKKIQLFNGKDLSNWEFFLKKPTVDPKTVFIAKNGLIHMNPNPWGYMRTKESYSDYKLHVEWCYPVEATNSGVFVHYQPRDSVAFKWIECQLGAGNAGDFICEKGIDMDERVNKTKGGVKKLEESSEKKVGEWNTMEVICIANTIEVYVNGVLQNKGTNLNVNQGAVGLQVEGKDIEFRNLYLRKQKK